jgi:predicted P-loop ATPase
MPKVTLFHEVTSKTGIPSEGAWNKLLAGELAPTSPESLFNLWTPAELHNDARKGENVRFVHALVLDFDGKKCAKSGARAVRVDEALERWPFNGYWHYTRSHTDAHPCFRLVMPIEPVDAVGHSELYQLALARERDICADVGQGTTVDEHCSDPARLWYLPSDGYSWQLMTGEPLTPEIYESWAPPEEPQTDIDSPTEAPQSAGRSQTFDPLAPDREEVQDAADEMRIAAYLSSMPPSIAGSGGHLMLFNAARKVAQFGITNPEEIARILDQHFNGRCEPPWSLKELLHKGNQALKAREINPIPKLTSKKYAAYVRANGSGQTHQDPQIFQAQQTPNLPAFKPFLPKSADAAFGPLILSDKGRIEARASNLTWLTHNKFGACIRFDEFVCKLRVVSALPWNDHIERDWSDFDDLSLMMWLERHCGARCNAMAANQAAQSVGYFNRFDSYTDHMAQIAPWDGVERLDTWLSVYLGAAATNYTRLVGRAFLISIIARAYEPGVEVHTMLVLEGAQGIGKTQAAAVLAGRKDWVSSSIPDLQSKDAAMSLLGKVIVEIAELSAISRSSNEAAKEFVTRSWDKFRPPFGRNEVNYPRRCVFIATTNHTNYLTDETGNRRYWPVRCSSKANITLLAREREQLFAEAKVAYASGEKWYGRDIETDAFIEQRKRNETDPWDDEIDRLIHDNRRTYNCPERFADFVSTDEIMRAFGIDVSHREVRCAKRISRMMRARGWEPVRVERTVNGRRHMARGFGLTASSNEQVMRIHRTAHNAAMEGAESNFEGIYEVIAEEGFEKIEIDESRKRATFSPGDDD